MTDPQGFAARSAALRETAKWLAVVFVGAGAILFSGLSFTNLSAVADSKNAVAIVVLAACPLLAAAVAVASAARVISTPSPSVGEILPQYVGSADQGAYQKNLKEIESLQPSIIAIHNSVSAYEAKLVARRKQLDNARKLSKMNPGSLVHRDAVDKAEMELSELQSGTTELVVCVKFARVRRRFKRATIVIATSALLAVSSVAAAGVVAGNSVDESKAPQPAGTGGAAR